jgi:hypothetical protein
MRFYILIALCVFSASTFAQTKPSATTKPVKGLAAPAPESLLGSMLKPRTPIQPLPDPPRIDPATNKIVPPNPPTPTLKREGTFITDQVCRMQKTLDGQGFELVFDTDGKGLADPPVGVIQNQNLASMELMIEGINRDPKFHVTGMMTEYKGKNYILIEKATIVSDVIQQF